MAGYPAHENAAVILAKLEEALGKAGGESRERIGSIIVELDPIKDNRTFMRTQKAERVTEELLPVAAALAENPSDPENLSKMETDIAFLVEKVKTFVIRMT